MRPELNLPAWVYVISPDVYTHNAKLQIALEVAWEAMDCAENTLPLGDPLGRMMRENMRRIEGL